jgi:hypothetical protein
VIPGQAELSLLETLRPVELDRLEECLASGMLVDRGAAIGFRHSRCSPR